MRNLGRYLIVLIIAGLVGGACLVKTSPGRSGHAVSKPEKHKKAKKHKKSKGKKKGHDKHR